MYILCVFFLSFFLSFFTSSISHLSSCDVHFMLESCLRRGMSPTCLLIFLGLFHAYILYTAMVYTVVCNTGFCFV
jgi:hypothetical protein